MSKGGESAFPTRKSAGELSITQGGLTKREYLVAEVLQGSAVLLYEQYGNHPDIVKKLVDGAFAIADEVLARKD